MYSVYIIDDEQLICQGLKRFIPWEDYGFSIKGSSTSSVEALYFIRDNDVDIVFTDVKMPKMSGFELIDQIHALGKSPLFVILSGHKEFDLIKEAIGREVVDYLLKPIQEDELLDVLHRIRRKLDKSDSLVDNIPPYLNLDKVPRKIILDIISYVEQNISSELNLNALSKEFSMNPNYISQLIKSQLHITFSNLLCLVRMNKAKELLVNSTLCTYEIASLVGYNDSRYFSQIFKKHFGVTPTEFRDSPK